MLFNIMEEMDPIFETMTLLFVSYNFEMVKKELIHQLMQSIGDGEGFYEKNFHSYEKYINYFQKNRISGERDSFYFEDTSLDFFCALSVMFLEERDLLHGINQMNNDQLMQLIFRYSEDIFDRTLPEFSEQALADFMEPKNLTSFINSLEVSEREKWKIHLILHNPIEYLSEYAKLIRDNIPAYEAAVKAVKGDLKKSLGQFSTMFRDDEKAKEYFQQHNIGNIEIAKLVPTMANTHSVLVMRHTCYFGLLADKVFELMGKQSGGKDYLLTCLKALSDKSKLDILMSLKERPKYATELAAEMGLTSATVSYHMGALLAARLVYLEKSNGKYYYHVDLASINDFLSQMRQIFLNADTE